MGARGEGSADDGCEVIRLKTPFVLSLSKDECKFFYGLMLSLGLLASTANAQPITSWPTKPIRLIVPQAPGGSNDILARALAHNMSERLGKQVVVDNRAGAESMIGTDIVARAAPDGYTLLMASAAFVQNAAIHKLPYEPVKSFDWAGKIGNGPTVLAVHPGFAANSVKDIVAQIGRAHV